MRVKTTLLGSNGRLGGMLKRHAIRTGLDWTFQQRNGPSGLSWSGDFNDPEAEAIFGEGDTIINMVGETGADQDRLEATNIHFVHALLNRAKNAGVAHVVLASTAAVYGPGHGAPFAESDALWPVTAYGVSKVAMEETAYACTNGPAITILRIGNVAGADALLSAAYQCTSRGQPLSLHRFSNGSAAERSYIGPSSLAEVVTKLAQRATRGVQILNIAHPMPVYLDDLLAGYKAHLLPDLTWESAPAPDGVPPSVVLDTSALCEIHSFEDTTDPADLFARQVAEDSIA
jgi:UDP-glucose 4-epimerase